jgi:hypothetical protein
MPAGLALDAIGNLYVADEGHHRVLEYDTPLLKDRNADRVVGQPDFFSGTPLSAIAGGPAFTLTITGTDFIHGTVVSWNGAAQPTMVISETLLTAQIGAHAIATAGVVSVTIALPDGSASNPSSFTVNNPLPTIDQLSHTKSVAGSSAFTLTISGTQFVGGSVARWNDLARPTTVVSSTQLAVAISLPLVMR